jgi:hypothetical protein
MHSHVRRNAYVYTTADLAMTVMNGDDDDATLQDVSLTPDDHHSGSSSSSGTAAITKERPSPIPIRVALEKLGLYDSSHCGGDIVVVTPVRTVASSKTAIMAGSSKLEKLRHQRALYHQPYPHAHRMRIDDVRVVYAYCEIFPIPEENEDDDAASTTTSTNDLNDGVVVAETTKDCSFDCRVVCQIRTEVHALARKRPPALVEIPDEEDDDDDDDC